MLSGRETKSFPLRRNVTKSYKWPILLGIAKRWQSLRSKLFTCIQKRNNIRMRSNENDGH